jgi:hypothetical protein
VVVTVFHPAYPASASLTTVSGHLGQAGIAETVAGLLVTPLTVGAPPLRLPLGTDAVERIEAKLDLIRRELDQWRRVALYQNLRLPKQDH